MLCTNSFTNYCVCIWFFYALYIAVIWKYYTSINGHLGRTDASKKRSLFPDPLGDRYMEVLL